MTGNTFKDKNIFGDRLKRIREINKLSMLGLARILKVDRVTIWRWETGKKLPSLETVREICHRLGYTADFLLANNHLQIQQARRRRELRLIAKSRRLSKLKKRSKKLVPDG